MSRAEHARIGDLPDALERVDEILERLAGRRPAVFLDYDGTLTPIVDDPAKALIPESTKAAIEALVALVPVAIVSGRDLDDVRALVGVGGIAYAGSHGFDTLLADGRREQQAEEFLPALDAAEAELVSVLAGIPGAWAERKRFAIAVHFRKVEDARVPEVDAAVARVASNHRDLRRTGGKRIYELRPDVDWDKGRALLRLLDVLGLDRADVVPIYLGDDETDEDGFRAIAERGLGLVVRGEDDDRPTAARYRFADTGEVCRFLERLAQVVAGGGGQL